MSEQDQVATEETARPPTEAVVTDETGPGGLAQPAEASDPAGPKPDESAPSETKPKQSGRSAQRKLNKLNRELKQSQASNAELKQQVADLAGKVETLANPKPAEPKFEDFDSPQEYAKEYAKWEAPAPAPKAMAPPTPAPPVTEPVPKPSDDPEMVKFRKAGSDKFGDQFNDAMADETLAVSQVMGDFLLDSEVGPDVYLHLSDNQDLARQIANKSPHAAIKRMEELEKQAKEGKLEGAEGELRDVVDVSTIEAQDPAQPKVATKAPAPPKDQDDRGTMTIKPDPENESMDEYAARRGKEQAAAGYR